MELRRHPKVTWAPPGAMSYRGLDRLPIGEEGTLRRIEIVPAAHRDPTRLRLVTEFEGNESSRILLCDDAKFIPKLHSVLNQHGGIHQGDR